MADYIGATPQNPLLGLLYGGYDYLRSPQRTQQMQGLASLLESTGLPKTIERMSYGEPLTNIGQANVPLLKPETAEAMMTVAPMAGPAARASVKGVQRAGGLLGQEMVDRLTTGRSMLPSLLAEPQATMFAINPDNIKTFPKRMKHTNKAIKEGGDIAGATGKDYEEIFAKATEKVKNKESPSIQEAAKLTKQEIQQRRELANEVLSQPIEQWTPPKNSLLDRSVMQSIPNLGGVKDISQAGINRYVAPRADTGYLSTLATPENLDLITRSINRGIDATQGGFYKSFQPMKAALDVAGYSPDVFEKGLAAGSFASARNKVAQENAIASLMMGMEQRGIPITPENILKEHDAFKALTGGGLSMMEGHTKPFAKYLAEGFPTGEKDVQKITSFYQNKLGNYQPYVLDTHEAGGLSYATPHAPVFWKQGGFKDTEYGTVENMMQNQVANKLGLDPAIAQESRWFGLGELTGLKTGAGDWLDNYEKQAAYSAQQLGKELTRKEQQKYVVDAFAGREKLLPWYVDRPIPDVRKGLLD